MLHGEEDYTCPGTIVTPVRGSQGPTMLTNGFRLEREIAG